jgi:4-amino-4-deoxy-L-arabinose transferase-like glycosyltransferase
MASVETTPPVEQIARVLIGSLALMAAFIGQLVMYVAPTGLLLGLALSASALLLFVWISVQPPPIWLVTVVKRFSLSYRVLLIGVAVGLALTATAGDIFFEQLRRNSYVSVITLWLGSIGAYIAAFAYGRKLPGQVRAWLRQYRTELIGIGAVTLLAAALRLYQLGDIPRVINGDEGLIGQAALQTHQHPLANPFSLFENIGALYLQGIQLSIRLFGQTPFSLRLLPAISGTLSIPALYLLGRRLFGVRVGLFAAFLLATSHTHLHFSRTVAVSYIHGTLLTPLELYFFLSGIENRSALRLALGGLILGLHFSIYLGAQITIAFLLIYLLIAAWLCRPLIQNALRQTPVFWGGIALAALPIFVYGWRHPDQWLARLNADGTFQSGWLTNTMAETGQSAPQVLMGRVVHAFLSLNHYPALDFYGAPAPVLGLTTGVLFVLGLGCALWRTRNHRYLLLNGYFWSTTIAIGVFSIPPSADSYRMLLALPAAMLLAAVGLEQVLIVLTPDNVATRRTASVAASVILVLAAVLFDVRIYFSDFAAQCRYGNDLQTRFASYLGNYLRTVDREADIYLLNDDTLLYGTHGSVDFLSRGRLVTNVPEPAETLSSTSNMVVIAIPKRGDELKAWAQAHTGGQFHREYDCGNLMLTAYRIP